MNLSEEFKVWIREQGLPASVKRTEEKDLILLDAEYAKAEIRVNMYDLNITEFRIISKKDNEDKFYLHFQLVDFDHAKELYQEMIGTFMKLKEEQKIRVLLSCSSGMTTGFFATKLNEASELLGKNYEFFYCSADRIYQAGHEYDIILIAPQIAFMFQKIKGVFSDKLCIRLPVGVFGGYDAGECIRLIDEAYEKYMSEEDEAVYTSMRSVETDKRILVMGMLLDSGGTRLTYRIYEKGTPEQTQTIMKEKVGTKDIEDVMDTVIACDKGIDAVCISSPGIVFNGMLNLDRNNYDHFDLEKHLSDKYHIPFVICNNANAITLGLYATNNKYSSIVYHSQLSGSMHGGQGVVINGQLVSGKRGYAGEIQYMMPLLNMSYGFEDTIWSPESMSEVIAKTLVATVCTVAPQAIIVRCDMLADMDDIREYMENFLPAEVLPDLFLVKNIREYLLFGQMIICLEELENRKVKKSS